MHQVADGLGVFNAHVALDEDEVADDVVRDPFELVWLEAGLKLVPMVPVLARTRSFIFDVLKDQLASFGIGVLSIPQGVDLFGLEQVREERGFIVRLVLAVSHHGGYSLGGGAVYDGAVIYHGLMF